MKTHLFFICQFIDLIMEAFTLDLWVSMKELVMEKVGDIIFISLSTFKKTKVNK